MSERLVVYGFDTSNNMKVRVALGYKGIDYELRRIDPADRSEIERLSGQPLTPMIVHGDRVLFDSAAILRYLDANFPDTPRLFGPDRDTMRAIEDWEGFARRELAEPMMMQIRERLVGGVRPETRERAAVLFEEVTARVEGRLADQEWLVGERLTAADVTAAPVVWRATAADYVPLPPDRERTRAWTERVMAYDRPPDG